MRRDAERAGVALRTGHDAVAVDLDAAECLVLATGASWERSGFSAFRPERAAIPGSDQDNVIDIGTAIDHVILDPTSLGRKVVILDETQDALPAGLADLLAQAGTSVEILSPHLHFGDALARSYDLGFIMRRLTRLGITITPQHFVERISARVVHAYGIWDAKPRAIDDVDTLVMSLGRRPILALLKTPAARRAEPLRIARCPGAAYDRSGDLRRRKDWSGGLKRHLPPTANNDPPFRKASSDLPIYTRPLLVAKRLGGVAARYAR